MSEEKRVCPYQIDYQGEPTPPCILSDFEGELCEECDGGVPTSLCVDSITKEKL